MFGDFGGVQCYFDVVECCEFVYYDGSIEWVLYLKGGGSVCEWLVLFSDDDCVLCYMMVEFLLLVVDYVSMMCVDLLGLQCCWVIWVVMFDVYGGSDEEVCEVVLGIYCVGLEGLCQLYVVG